MSLNQLLDLEYEYLLRFTTDHSKFTHKSLVYQTTAPTNKQKGTAKEYALVDYLNLHGAKAVKTDGIQSDFECNGVLYELKAGICMPGKKTYTVNQVRNSGWHYLTVVMFYFDGKKDSLKLWNIPANVAYNNAHAQHSADNRMFSINWGIANPKPHTAAVWCKPYECSLEEYVSIVKNTYSRELVA